MSARTRAAPWFRSDLAIENVLFSHSTVECVDALWMMHGPPWRHVPESPSDEIYRLSNLCRDVELAYGWSTALFRWVVPWA